MATAICDGDGDGDGGGDLRWRQRSAVVTVVAIVIVLIARNCQHCVAPTQICNCRAVAAARANDDAWIWDE
jgi:hypothetical protein